MSLFGFLRHDERTGGLIEFFGLTAWWQSEFTDTEREYILKTFRPLGGPDDSLASGRIIESSDTPIGLLTGLASWFSKPEGRHLAKRILAKAEEFVTGQTRPLDVHFLYQQEIEVYYRDRHIQRDCLAAIDACEKQIGLAEKVKKTFLREYGGDLPSHTGYRQLAIIREREKNWPEVIHLCEMAAKQGWSGDWAKRIARCRKRINDS